MCDKTEALEQVVAQLEAENERLRRRVLAYRARIRGLTWTYDRVAGQETFHANEGYPGMLLTFEEAMNMVLDALDDAMEPQPLTTEEEEALSIEYSARPMRNKETS